MKLVDAGFLGFVATSTAWRSFQLLPLRFTCRLYGLGEHNFLIQFLGILSVRIWPLSTCVFHPFPPDMSLLADTLTVRTSMIDVVCRQYSLYCWTHKCVQSEIFLVSHNATTRKMRPKKNIPCFSQRNDTNSAYKAKYPLFYRTLQPNKCALIW